VVLNVGKIPLAAKFVQRSRCRFKNLIDSPVCWLGTMNLHGCWPIKFVYIWHVQICLPRLCVFCQLFSIFVSLIVQIVYRFLQMCTNWTSTTCGQVIGNKTICISCFVDSWKLRSIAPKYGSTYSFDLQISTLGDSGSATCGQFKWFAYRLML
jgi:hypothetical protein